jgi:hypothetical protein
MFAHDLILGEPAPAVKCVMRTKFAVMKKICGRAKRQSADHLSCVRSLTLGSVVAVLASDRQYGKS